MNGRVCKKAAVLLGRRTRSNPPPQQASDSSTPPNIYCHDSEQGYLGPEHSPATSPVGTTAVEESTREPRMRGRSQTEPGCDNADKQKTSDNCGQDASVSEFLPESIDRIRQDSPPKPPLSSYPELFIFEKPNEEIGTALALSKLMVWRWNTVLQCEDKVANYSRTIHQLQKEELNAERIIEKIDQRVDDAGEDPLFDIDQARREFEDAEEIRLRLRAERARIELKLGRKQDEMELAKSKLIREWERLLAENNLLEPAPADSDEGSHHTDGGRSLERNSQTPTASEAARYAAEDARAAAIKELHLRERHLQGARHKLDHWQEHYEHEYRAHQECIAERGRSLFDNMLLRQQQEATAALIAAEEAFEASRKHVRALGVVLHDTDQESGFASYAEDGYRESMEADMVRLVDRERIERWMNEPDRPSHPADCDEWDSEEVGLCDSISVVAQGKGRKRIDRWRSMCELLEIDALGDV
ncbi:hypothetical protein M430DRAFT_59665 [Amorphotheca resinae ATCC 22711]|uniref:Uncharacterized protein n=1 Tax=Amorphotheca resinae ATCC 22711 TaxID=857342 RepID=A0A2T3AY44_AMORE|nr:hypothetical protein M430DRAFT_59665 [Amorphotheca resinae ATCC 22711]PSS14995.1 hypothetical protein M430DRAFT_59665 [Amorphotheca resinae ATCC 22711]